MLQSLDVRQVPRCEHAPGPCIETSVHHDPKFVPEHHQVQTCDLPIGTLHPPAAVVRVPLLQLQEQVLPPCGEGDARRALARVRDEHGRLESQASHRALRPILDLPLAPRLECLAGPSRENHAQSRTRLLRGPSDVGEFQALGGVPRQALDLSLMRQSPERLPPSCEGLEERIETRPPFKQRVHLLRVLRTVLSAEALLLPLSALRHGKVVPRRPSDARPIAAHPLHKQQLDLLETPLRLPCASLPALSECGLPSDAHEAQ
mmetsp:Transcript_103931/g.333157  ORF Transcript_103931/g.333157 Transcript_103931/m.333157 type:complete len:261 (-) Transcript_103931:760-1542(-)